MGSTRETCLGGRSTNLIAHPRHDLIRHSRPAPHHLVPERLQVPRPRRSGFLHAVWRKLPQQQLGRIQRPIVLDGRGWLVGAVVRGRPCGWRQVSWGLRVTPYGMGSVTNG